MAETPQIGVGNLDLQQQLNNLIAERAKILARHNTEITTHNQLIDALSNIVTKQKGVVMSNSDAFAQLNAAMEENARKAKEAEEAQKELNKRLEEAADKAAFLGGVFKTVFSGLKLAGKAIGFTIGVVGDLIKSFFRLAKSIIMLPFAMLRGLISLANELPTGPSPIALRIEEIRKAFGDLATNEGRLVKGSLKEIRAEMKNFAGTGLTVGRMFGYGSEGLAKAMEEFQAIATALGPNLNRLAGDIRGNIPELLALTRGFTGSAEATAAMLNHAKSLGRDGTKEIIKFAGMAQRMGKQYGVSAKIIGKAVGEMSKDISNFGSLSAEQMTAAAVYASKLGLEIKDLAGVMNKFLNFEDAAKGAAQMAQAFGMNIDALELMKGGPEAIDEMRKAFFASGRSLESMSMAERKLLEEQSTLTGAAFEAAFSTEGQNQSYSQMAESAEDAGSIQEQQIKVMRELGKSIDRVFGSGGKPFKSFFEAMSDGFTKGLLRAVPMKQLLLDLRRALFIVGYEFRKVGVMFVEHFPGLKDFLEGLRGLFVEFDKNGKKVSRFSIAMESFHKIFKKFLTSLGDPKLKGKAVQTFLDDIKKSLSDAFSGDKTKLLSGSNTILSTVTEIFKQLMIIALNGIADFVSYLSTELPKAFDESAEPTEAGKTIRKLKDAIVGLFEEIKKAVEPKIKKATDDLLKYYNDYLKTSPEWQTLKDTIQGTLVSIIMGAISSVALMSAITSGGKLLAKNMANKLLGEKVFRLTGSERQFTKMFSKIPKSAADAGSKSLSLLQKIPGANAIGKFFGKIGSKIAAGPAIIAVAVATAAIDISDSINKFAGDLQSKGFDPANATVAAGITGLINTITFGLLPDSWLSGIAEATAYGTEFFQDMLSYLFGDNAAASVMQAFEGVFTTLGGFGTLLKGLWDGDREVIQKGIVDFFMGLGDIIVGSLTFIIGGAVNLIVNLFIGAFSLVTAVFSKAFKIIAGLIDAAFGGDGSTGVGRFFRDLAEGFDKLTQWFSEVYDMWKKINIEEIVVNTGLWISETFTKFVGWIEGTYDKVTTAVSDVFADVANAVTGVINLMASIPSVIWNIVTTIFEYMTWPFRAGWEFISTYFTVDKFFEIGDNILAGITNGIGDIGGAIKEKFTAAVDGVKDFLGISSPSKLFTNIGTNMSEGLQSGMDDMPEMSRDIFKDVASNAEISAKNISTSYGEGLRTDIQSSLDGIPDMTESAFKRMPKMQKMQSPGLSEGNVDGLKKSYEALSTHIIQTFEKTFSKIGEMTDKASRVIGSTFVAGFASDAFFKGMELSFEKLSITLVKTLVGPFNEKLLKVSAENVADFTDQLTVATNKILDIGEKFAKSLSFDAIVDLTDSLNAAKTVKVDTSGMTYTFNMTVTIDAEKLAENLVKTGKLKETLGLK
jgi:hypothetical protein